MPYLTSRSLRIKTVLS